MIGAETGQGFIADGAAVPAHGQVLDRVGHAHDGMEDEQVCDEVVVFDCLALLVALGGRPPTKMTARVQSHIDRRNGFSGGSWRPIRACYVLSQSRAAARQR